VPGVPSCARKPVGAIPPPTASAATTGASGPTGPASTATTGTTGPAKAHHAKAKRPAKRKP
jgi:hypothetical protein